MRILFLYPRTLDSESSVGGVAEFLCALMPLLKAKNIEPLIYAGDKKAKKITIANDTLVDAKVFNGPFLKPSWFFSRSLIDQVALLCKQEKIDLIHAQGTYLAGFMALQIFKRTGIPYIVTSHGDILSSASKRMKRERVRKRCQAVLKYAAKITHLTPMMAEVSHALFPSSEKSIIIGNGIHYEAWQSYNNLSEKNFLLAIGRLESGKGFHVLIEMYAKLIKSGVTIPLVIAGKGTKEALLQQQVQKLGLNLITDHKDFTYFPEKSVIFIGYVRDDAKKSLIAQSKIVLFATQPAIWEEAFGIVQLEAMAAGKPLIASDTSATRFLQAAGMACVIVPPADAAAWTKETSLLLIDDLRRKRMGLTNRRTAFLFDWLPIANQYMEVYRNILTPAQPPL